MKVISSAVLMLASMASGASLKGGASNEVEIEAGRGLQTEVICNDVVNGLVDMCEQQLGCQCNVVIPSPDDCSEKALRLVSFQTTGEDPNVANLDSGADDPFDGDGHEIEFRFSLVDSTNHYPANLATCGPGSALNGEVRLLDDGERYCSMLFGSTVLAQGATFKSVPGIDDSTSVVSFRAFESDNQVEPDQAVPLFNFQGNLNPGEWYDATCTPYLLRVYAPYNGSARTICYVSNENLNLNIPECANNLIPVDNFYTFVFQVASIVNLPN